MSVVVRPALVDDAAWLAGLSRESFAARLHPYLISAQTGIGRFWEVVIAHPGSFPDRCFLVAESEGGERLGFADLTLVEQDRAHLSYICVAESARGRGVARELLRAFIARHSAVRSMQLDVFADNTPARALYAGLGFAVEATTTWWVADLPVETTPDDGVRLDGLHSTRAWLECYGFAELSADVLGATVRLGLPSAAVLRCFDPATLLQPALITAVARELPEIEQVLVMTPGDNAPQSAVGVLGAVNRSIRMSTSEIRTSLEHC